MHPDNKILISAVLILGIALVSFNIGGFSGMASKIRCHGDIVIKAEKNSIGFIETEIWIPEEEIAGVDYCDISYKRQVEVRRLSGAKVSDPQIPKDQLGLNYMKFSFRAPIPEGSVCVEDKDGRRTCDNF